MSAPSTDAPTIRVVIADDHQVFVQGLETLLNNAPQLEVSGVAYNGKQLMHLLQGHHPDVVLLDLRMPVMDGWQVARETLDSHPKLRLLVLTSLESRTFLPQLSELGVRGFLHKNSGVEEIIQAIWAVYRGETFIGSSLQASLAASLYTSSNNNLEEDVSDREWQILHLITQAFTTPEIANKLCLSPHTVRAHRSNLLRKLRVKNTAGLVKLAWERGWV